MFCVLYDTEQTIRVHIQLMDDAKNAFNASLFTLIRLQIHYMKYSNKKIIKIND